MNIENTPAFRAAELAVHLSRALPDVSVYRIAKFITHAQRVTKDAKRHCINLCNDADYVAAHVNPDTGEDACLRRIELEAVGTLEVLGDVGGKVAFAVGGDPRGACGQVRIEGVPGDDMDRDAFDIY